MGIKTPRVLETLGVFTAANNVFDHCCGYFDDVK